MTLAVIASGTARPIHNENRSSDPGRGRVSVLWAVMRGSDLIAAARPLRGLRSARRAKVSFLRRREWIVALLESLVEAIWRAAVGADVALADEPSAVDFDELRILAPLLVQRRGLAHSFVRDARPDDMRLRAIAFDFDDRVREQHAVARPRRGVRVACAATAVERLDLCPPVGERAVDVEQCVLGEVLRHFVGSAHRQIVVVANEQIFDLNSIEQGFHGDLLSPRRRAERREQECDVGDK
jgi:hypothetical protein